MEDIYRKFYDLLFVCCVREIFLFWDLFLIKLGKKKCRCYFKEVGVGWDFRYFLVLIRFFYFIG